LGRLTPLPRKKKETRYVDPNRTGRRSHALAN
jgi:hypothetical protein